MQRQQNSTNHPVPILLVSSTDNVTPIYGASPSAYVGKDGGTLTPASGGVSEASLTTPTGLSVTPTGVAGSTTYGYRVSALNGYGETMACVEVTTTTGNATLNGSNYNALSWTAVAGASTYNVYGRTSGAELKLVNQAGTTYNDTGAATPSGALPTQNTTSGGWYNLAGNATDRNTLGTSKITLTATGCLPGERVIEIVAYDPFNGPIPANVTQLLGSANWPNLVNSRMMFTGTLGSQAGMNSVQISLGVAASGLPTGGGWLIFVQNGSSNPQTRIVTSFNTSTYVATVATPWDSQPASGNTVNCWAIELPGNSDSLLSAVISSPAPTTTVFAGGTNLSSTDSAYNNCFLVFKGSAANGPAPARKITAYVGASKTITVGTAFPITPVAGDVFEIIGYAGT